MATIICKRRKMVLAFTVSLVMKISCTGIKYIPGQTAPDDPYACVWITGFKKSICCDGYFKTDATDPTGKCIECPNGSYGFFCQDSCNCENGATCNTVDGSCRCSARYFGNNCQYHCNCQNGATCMRDGRCVCVDGFYGELCQRECSCPENSKCMGETGQCLCHDGFYGDSCLPCNCPNTEQCDPFTGACTCRPGYYGDNCDKLCSCFNDAYCGNDQANNCICSSGWIGSECTDCDAGIRQSYVLSFCEDKCLHCYNGNRCSVQNGDCLCSPGWQGNKCDKKCGSGFHGNNCSEVCQCLNAMCDHITGICKCESGWTGQYCEEPCPDNCLVCNDDICTQCKTGWTGEQCSNSCKPGFHGDSCQERCTECNCSTSCHHVDGSCPDIVRCEGQKCKYENARLCMENPFKLECQDGWTERLCNVRTTMTTVKDDFNLSYEYRTPDSSTSHEAESPTCMDESFNSSTLILIFILFATVPVLINIAVVIAACYYLKRQIRPRNRSHDCGEIEENVETNDHQRRGTNSEYENIPGRTETTMNSEVYQHLCEFTYSQYQKLDTSAMGGSRTQISVV